MTTVLSFTALLINPLEKMLHSLTKHSLSIRLFCAMAMSSTAFGFVLKENQNSKWPSTNDRIRLMLADETFFKNTTNCEETSLLSGLQSYKKMEVPQRGATWDGHAIFGLLLGEQMIERYDVFRRPDDSESEDIIIAYVKLGDRIDGHPGVVHGGILSLIFDDALGFGYEALKIPMAVTANLNVDYRAPVPADTQVRVAAQLEKREGRKLFWKAQMTSIDQKVLFAEATSLYIIPRSVAEKMDLSQ
jgi:acyl-coenzyme A thioesterase PaaI-like protein